MGLGIPSLLGSQVESDRPKFNSWRDNLTFAFYRGIPFFVEKHEFTFGRRIDVKELTNSNNVVVRDKGGLAERFNITAYLVQNADNGWDYFDARNALIEALRLSGRAELVHPFLGRIYVRVDGAVSLKEDLHEGGYCEFDIPFVQDKEPWSTPTEPAYRQNILAAAKRARSLSADANLARQQAISVTSKVLLTSRNIISGTRSALGKVRGALANVKGIYSSVINQAQGLISDILFTVETALSSICEMSDTFGNVGGAFKAIVGIGVEPIENIIRGGCSGLPQETGEIIAGENIPQELGESVCNSILDMIETDYFDTKLTIEADLMRSISDNLNINLLSSVCEIAISTTFINRENYDDLLKKIKAAFDLLLLHFGEFEDSILIYNILMEMREVFFNNALKRVDMLAKQVVYNVLPTYKTSLHIAHSRYGDLGRAKEIQDMNRNVEHPGFLPQGERIMILNE
jgi:prophage DNA circulation protein